MLRNNIGAIDSADHPFELDFIEPLVPLDELREVGTRLDDRITEPVHLSKTKLRKAIALARRDIYTQTIKATGVTP